MKRFTNSNEEITLHSLASDWKSLNESKTALVSLLVGIMTELKLSSTNCSRTGGIGARTKSELLWVEE